MSPSCTLLSPALPSEFLSYVLDHHAHPTTLIICSSRSDFLSSLIDDIRGHDLPSTPSSGEQGDNPNLEQQAMRSDDDHVKHRLLCSPIYQVAVSRHIRTIYTPTATHLRAYLSVFSTGNSKVVAPPARFAGQKKSPHLLLYGFLDLHRDTSEWSAQGLGNSAAALVDLGHRLSWDITVVEPRKEGYGTRLEQVLKETVPILSSGGRRFGLDSEDGGWSGRTVEVGRVLMRWFRFQRSEWERDTDTDAHVNVDADKNQDTAMGDCPP